MGYVRALATVLLSTADPGRADCACSFSQECGRPRDGAGRKRARIEGDRRRAHETGRVFLAATDHGQQQDRRRRSL